MMSSTKQAMLQSLLKDGFAAAAGTQSGSSASAVPLDPVILAGVESQLLPMGFSQQQVRQAAAAVSGRAGRPTGSTSASDAVSELALDWLFIHLSADQMPRQYRTGGSAVLAQIKPLACVGSEMNCTPLLVQRRAPSPSCPGIARLRRHSQR